MRLKKPNKAPHHSQNGSFTEHQLHEYNVLYWLLPSFLGDRGFRNPASQNSAFQNQSNPQGAETELVIDPMPDSVADQDQQLLESKVGDSSPTVSSIDDLDILDWQDALTRSANKPDLAATLITMMLDSITTEKEALTQAWQARDRNELSQIAHRILGASRYTGVPQLRQASQNLEDKCLLNTQHTTPAQFAMLKPYFDTLMLALSNLQMLDLAPYPQLNYHRLSENDMNWKMI